MNYFAAGGKVGFFVAPVLATPALSAWGLGATALFIAPGTLMAWISTGTCAGSRRPRGSRPGMPGPIVQGCSRC